MLCFYATNLNPIRALATIMPVAWHRCASRLQRIYCSIHSRVQQRDGAHKNVVQTNNGSACARILRRRACARLSERTAQLMCVC